MRLKTILIVAAMAATTVLGQNAADTKQPSTEGYEAQVIHVVEQGAAAPDGVRVAVAPVQAETPGHGETPGPAALPGNAVHNHDHRRDRRKTPRRHLVPPPGKIPNPC